MSFDKYATHASSVAKAASASPKPITTQLHATTLTIGENFAVRIGDGYTVISDVVKVDGKPATGPNSYQIKTAKLDELIRTIVCAETAFKAAKTLEEGFPK